MILSIITINRNNAEGLKKTLASVAAQTHRQIEHIIVDGASTDGSVEVIKEYEIANQSAEMPLTIRWISEPDSGIYNAMNKGIMMATGEYIQILNSGDVLADNSVTVSMIEALRINKFPSILYGNMIHIDENGKKISRSGYTEYSLRNFYSGTLNHDCCYILRELFADNRYGLYDETLKIVSDWKWFLQTIGLGKVKPIYVDIDVTYFDMSGISTTNLKLRNKERRQVLEDIIPPAVLWDYDNHAFDAEQMNRLRRHHLYPLVYFIERLLFKLEKWHILRR